MQTGKRPVPKGRKVNMKSALLRGVALAVALTATSYAFADHRVGECVAGCSQGDGERDTAQQGGLHVDFPSFGDRSLSGLHPELRKDFAASFAQSRAAKI